MNTREQLFQSFASSPEYRHAFVEEKIRTGLAVQINTIRERREGMTQTAFAKKLGKAQSWVSRLEDPNEPIPTVPTLLLIARAFDVGLEVRFVPFASVLDDMTELSEESLHVPEFNLDPRLFPQEEGRLDALVIEKKPPAVAAAAHTWSFESRLSASFRERTRAAIATHSEESGQGDAIMPLIQNGTSEAPWPLSAEGGQPAQSQMTGS